jgi:NADPH:quinone reductase-like Zn-dependent oxidoreductase
VLSPFVRQRLRMIIATANAADLRLLTELVETGKVTPVVDRTYQLADAPAALAYLRQGHARGKVVLTV